MYNFKTLLNNMYSLVEYNERTLPGVRRGQSELVYNALLKGACYKIVVDKEKCLQQGGEAQYASTFVHELGHVAFWALYPELMDNITLRCQEGIADLCAAYVLAIKGVKWPKGLLLHFVQNTDMPNIEYVKACLKLILCEDELYCFNSVIKAFEKKSYDAVSEALANMLGL